MIEHETVEQSSQGNEYGQLLLQQVTAVSRNSAVTYKVGDHFLLMQGACGDQHSKPLTEEQVDAFYILFGIQR